jgi:DNA polymerase-3 subunit beta
MKFICDKAVILKEITVAQEIISSRNALSILSNVLLAAENNTLIIKATDLKVGFETKIPIAVERAGNTTVFCDKFLGILRSLPDGDVEFDSADGRLVIRPTGKKIDFQLKSIAADKFPEIREIAEERYFPFPQKDLNEMISETIFAVSDDETRYFMNGVFMEQQEGTLTMVATDGRRLSFVGRQVDANVESFDGVIVPPKILQLIKKLSSGEGNLSLAVSDKNIYVKFDNQKVSSTLIEGQFPNYRRVIPESQSEEVIVDRGELMEALKRVSLLVEQKSRRVRLELAEGVLTLKSEESEIGVAQEEIACTYSGPEVSIALNYLYLSEPLRVMDDEKVSLRFTEPTKAISLYSVPEKDFFHIIMPMQVD